ncbi:aquaporin-like [Leguminivora glycinivorella]|uniref:aquaporin-like n=1 Tax=Leguminivora glycinivorella TaxID=1035111 RepID=UPI00200EB94F|nr:aquaporin-like [Leguminivora glycinivorella]
MSLSSQDVSAPRRTKSRWSCGLDYTARGVLLAEWAGTALLVLLSCLPACAGAPMYVCAAAAGLAVALLVQCFDHISGAMFNPTVLLAAMLARRVAPSLGAGMFGAQLLGAATGSGVLHLLAPVSNATDLCMTLPMDTLSVYKAVCIEAILGGLLALANMASWDPRNRLLADSWPLRIGFIVAGLSIIAGPLTGASMNAARSFGPALWSGNWKHHWVYWVGPLSGSILCTLIYRRIWAVDGLQPARAAPDLTAALPLPALGRESKTHYSV